MEERIKELNDMWNMINNYEMLEAKTTKNI